MKFKYLIDTPDVGSTGVVVVGETIVVVLVGKVIVVSGSVKLKFGSKNFHFFFTSTIFFRTYYTVSPAGLEVLPLWAASGVGRPRPRLYKGWAAWNTISLQLDADRVRRLVTHGRQHVSL